MIIKAQASAKKPTKNADIIKGTFSMAGSKSRRTIQHEKSDRKLRLRNLSDNKPWQGSLNPVKKQGQEEFKSGSVTEKNPERKSSSEVRIMESQEVKTAKSNSNLAP